MIKQESKEEICAKKIAVAFALRRLITVWRFPIPSLSRKPNCSRNPCAIHNHKISFVFLKDLILVSIPNFALPSCGM